MKSFHGSSIPGGSAKVSCCLAGMYSLNCSHSSILSLGMGDWPSLPLVLAYTQFHPLLAPLEFVDSALSLELQT